MASSARSLALVQTTAVGFLEAIRAGAIAQVKRAETYTRLAEVIFSYWAAKLHHPRAILDSKRERFIVARLRETQGDWGLLCYAIDGAGRNDYLMGRTVRSEAKHDRISTIFRDLEQVETLAELCPKYRAGLEHPLVVKYQYPNGDTNAPTASQNEQA